MNCSQAKQIKIENFLKHLGIEPVKIYGYNFWYKAPYRTDNNPSFKVNTQKNNWYDMSTGNGGNIIDLVIQLFNTTLSESLSILQQREFSLPSFSFSDKQKISSSGIEMEHIQPLQNRALIQYLKKRNISIEIACNYVLEAYYIVKGKQYFALAFKNDKGGYELRNEYFKGGNSPKYITTIPGHDKSINVFEGFIDFLSALSYFTVKQPVNKTIILNTTINLPYAEAMLKSTDEVLCFLDNDDSGKKALNKIKELNLKVIDQAENIYTKYNDFNDFICNKSKAI